MARRFLGAAIRCLMPMAGCLRKAYWFLFRPKTRGSKILFFNDGELLLVRHTYEPRICGLPGGALKPGEDPVAGLMREVREELGIENYDAELIGMITADEEYNRDTIYVFTAVLSERARLVPNPIEIAEVTWAHIDQAPALGPVSKRILQLYRNSKTYSE